MMKISFPVVKGGSGADVFTFNLVSGLMDKGISAKIAHINPKLGFFPSVAGKMYNPGSSDIIHANSWNGFAFKRYSPLVVTEYHVVHDPILDPYRSNIQRFYHQRIFQYEKKSFNSADVVTSISRYTQKKLEQIFGYSDSKMIYCGIDTDLFKAMPINKNRYGIEEGKIILLYVGNLSRRKGADLLVPIMNKLGDRYALLTTTGLRDQTVIHHKNIISLRNLSVFELVHAYNICDIFLFPSRLEGFGLSVAEAMACEKPVITTNSSSLPELVQDDKGGILCEMDDISSFAESIRYLSEDENIRSSMGRYNRQRVLDLFTREVMVRKYISLYRKEMSIPELDLY